MTGPVAAARPMLLRPGPTTRLLKQLNSSAILSSPPPPSSVSVSQTLSRLPARGFSRLSTFGTRYQHQFSTCLACRIHQQARQARLYSTNPYKPGSDDPSQPPHESKSTDESTVSPSSPSHIPPDTSSTASSAPESTTRAQAEAQDEAQPQPQPHPAQPSPNEPELPSQADSRRSALSQNVSHFMDNLQSRVLVASQTLNDLTGYSAIERIKQDNARLEQDLAAAQAELRRARSHYQAVNARRASTQREVTTLLARKDTWAPSDLERFTALYRTDHELEAAVHSAASALTEAEADEARLSQSLNSGILKRYHEEQIWSDRIRRQSTWGTWGLMGVNFLMFLILQFVAEPWRRRRLMRGIAAEEKVALDAVRRELEEVRGALAGLEREHRAEPAAVLAAEESQPTATVEDAGVEASPVSAVPDLEDAVPVADFAAPQVSWKEFLSDPSLWRPAAEDLYSDRRIDLRMRDVSLIALEGAAAGAAVVVSIAFFLARRA